MYSEVKAHLEANKGQDVVLTAEMINWLFDNYRPTGTTANGNTITIRRWQKHGKDRLYISADGMGYAYIDRTSKTLVKTFGKAKTSRAGEGFLAACWPEPEPTVWHDQSHCRGDVEMGGYEVQPVYMSDDVEHVASLGGWRVCIREMDTLGYWYWHIVNVDRAAGRATGKSKTLSAAKRTIAATIAAGVEGTPHWVPTNPESSYSVEGKGRARNIKRGPVTRTLPGSYGDYEPGEEPRFF